LPTYRIAAWSRAQATAAAELLRRTRPRTALLIGTAAVTGDTPTRRGREVLSCLGEGLSNAEIATRLEMAEATVKTHVSRLLGKLELRSRVQAAVLAQELGV